MPILLREIFAAYGGERLPAAASYRKFITWLADRDLDAARAAWGEVLAGFDTPTLVGPRHRLPDRLGLGRRGFATSRLSEATTQALGELARSCHTTVSTVLQGAWAVLLSSLTGTNDVVFGTARSRLGQLEVADAESMVGLLINTVPVRANIGADTSTADLLEQLQTAHNDTLDHQHLALNEIHRVTGHDQLFDSLFVYENYPVEAGMSVGSGDDQLTVTGFTNLEFNHYPLTVEALPGNELSLHVEYDTDVFTAADIDGLTGRLSRLLAAMTADPTRKLSSINSLDAGEQDRLHRWSGAGVRAPIGMAQELLAAAVAAHPDAMAVVDGTRSFSYRALDEWSTRLARVLIEAGVGPERAVGVAVDRCAELVAAWWAVLKAGGIYVPVDRDHPVERIATVLDSVAAACVLTCGADTLVGAGTRPVLRIDGLDLSGHSRRPDHGPRPWRAPHRLRHLHVGFHRRAQGCGGQPRRSAGSGCRPTTRVRVGLRLPGADGGFANLRRLAVRDLAGNRLGVGTGGGASGCVRRRGADRTDAAATRHCDTADPDRGGIAGSRPPGRTDDADHRRRSVPRRVGARLGAGQADVQRLRPQRGHHLGDWRAADARAVRQHRHPDPWHADAGARRTAAPRPRRRGGRAVSGRAGAGTRLRGSQGV